MSDAGGWESVRDRLNNAPQGQRWWCVGRRVGAAGGEITLSNEHHETRTFSGSTPEEAWQTAGRELLGRPSSHRAGGELVAGLAADLNILPPDDLAFLKALWRVAHDPCWEGLRAHLEAVFQSKHGADEHYRFPDPPDFRQPSPVVLHSEVPLGEEEWRRRAHEERRRLMPGGVAQTADYGPDEPPAVTAAIERVEAICREVVLFPPGHPLAGRPCGASAPKPGVVVHMLWLAARGTWRRHARPAPLELT